MSIKIQAWINCPRFILHRSENLSFVSIKNLSFVSIRASDFVSIESIDFASIRSPWLRIDQVATEFVSITNMLRIHVDSKWWKQNHKDNNRYEVTTRGSMRNSSFFKPSIDTKFRPSNSFVSFLTPSQNGRDAIPFLLQPCSEPTSISTPLKVGRMCI